MYYVLMIQHIRTQTYTQATDQRAHTHTHTHAELTSQRKKEVIVVMRFRDIFMKTVVRNVSAIRMHMNQEEYSTICTRHR